MTRIATIFVLPTIHNRLVFHVQMKRPTTDVEYAILFSCYVFRKWRFMVSDAFGQQWHSFGVSAFQTGSEWRKKAYQLGNRLTTRVACDEYFFKMVPRSIDTVEIVYPKSVDVEAIKQQLDVWLKRTSQHQANTFAATILLPFTVYLSKFVFIPANALLCYQLFRISASFKATQGLERIKTTIDRKKVQWVASEDLEYRIREMSDSNTRKMGDWKWDPKKDLHDDVVRKLQDDLLIPELLQQYRRSRIQYFVYPKSI